jgi:hypothetical protein
MYEIYSPVFFPLSLMNVVLKSIFYFCGRMDDRNAEAHKWYAIVLGSRGEFGGVRLVNTDATTRYLFFLLLRSGECIFETAFRPHLLVCGQ